jgi:hypothetical protein
LKDRRPYSPGCQPTYFLILLMLEFLVSVWVYTPCLVEATDPY